MTQQQTRGLYLKSIQFNDDTTIDVARGSVLIFTGPNNCGKSRTLKEIVFHPIMNYSSIVTKSIKSEIEGNFREIISDVVRTQHLRSNSLHVEQVLLQSQSQPPLFFTLMAQNPHLYRLVIEGFVTHLNTLTRLLSFGTAPENTNLVNVQPFGMTALTRLYEDDVVASKVYEHTTHAFGRGVSMNHSAFQDNDLYFFNREDVHSELKEGTTAHARWSETLDRLNQQGDGVNSFSTILISIFQQKTPLILLDEPEAFLHPPQVRNLARVIAMELPTSTQLLVATHSDDFVRGMIDFAADRTTVIRMTRHRSDSGEYNKIKKLDSGEIKTLWDDPLLRTSDVLTSLFHKVAIIVEGDSDARFFRSMIDVVSGSESKFLDLKFFHCGGKDKIPKIVKALKAIGVSVLCIVDIDIIEFKQKLKLLFETFQGDFSLIEEQFDQISSYANQKRAPVKALAVKEAISEVFEKVDVSKPLTDEQMKMITDLVKTDSPWASIKQSGEAAFASGTVYNAFHHICNEAEKIGIFVNRVGELENYCRALSSRRKSEWLSEVLTLDLESDVNLFDARTVTKRILAACEALGR